MSETIEQTALAVLPTSLLPTILGADQNDILGKLAAKVAAFKPDVSTGSGRDEMRSLAYEIRRSKAELIRVGKGLTEDWRKQTKAVNEECSTIEDRMDALAEKVRAPLTEWEGREKQRVASHESALAAFREVATVLPSETSEEIRARLLHLTGAAFSDRDWQEFRDRYFEAKCAHEESLGFALAAAEKREADARELERLRAEEAERKRQEEERLKREREERIAAEAAERARGEAEAKAAGEAAEAARKAAEERAAIEREAERRRQVAERRVAAEKAEIERKAREAHEVERREREAAERREREAIEAVARAERERLVAEKKAKDDAIEAARKAEADKTAAINAERQKIAAEEAHKAAETAARERNRAHRAQVNNEAATALIASGLTEEEAQTAVTAIAKKQVPHVIISY